MKKLLYFLAFILILLVGFYSFVSSTYFFNKYIAKNIKEYGFNYVKVNGALLDGFVVEDLSYKGKKLSSNVELKINPFKLISGVVSVNKLHLIGVKKDVLENIVEDFKPQEDTSSATQIDLNFEFKDILLTIKPFTIDKIKIDKANLSIDKIAYINNKFNVGNLEYESKSDIANVSFSGQFKKRVLDIKHLEISSLDSVRLMAIIKSLKSSKESRQSSQLLNSPFTPKLVKLKDATLNLKPFKLKELTLKDLKLNIKNARFNVEKLSLNQGELKIKYLGNELELNLDSSYKNKILNIENMYLDLKKPNKIEKLITFNDSSESNCTSNNNLNVVKLNSINVIGAKVKVSNYKYNKELIKTLNIGFKNSSFSCENKKIVLNNLNLNIDSTLGNMDINATINKDFIFNNIKIDSGNIDKIIATFPSSNSNTTTKPLPLNIPANFIIKNLLVTGKKATLGSFIINDAKVTASNVKGKTEELNFSSGKVKAYVTSPWGEANLDGKIKDNNYYAKGSYKVAQYLLNQYSLPLKAKSFKRLNVDGRFGFKSLDINIDLKGKDILKSVKDITILSSKNRLQYNYITNDTTWKMNADINTPYSGNSKLNNTLIYIDKSDKLDYYGKLIPAKTIFNNKELQVLFKNLNLDYKGNSDKLNVNFNSLLLVGNFLTDYDRANISINNRKNIDLNSVIQMPQDYKNTTISKLQITSKLDFKKISPIKGNIILNSNLLNIDGKWSYNNILNSSFTTNVPKSSYIFKNNKKLKFNAFKSFNSKLTADSNVLNLELKNKLLAIGLDYNFNTTKLKSNVKAKAIKLALNGEKNKIDGLITISSINSALQSIYNIYSFDSKSSNINGKIDAKFKILNLQSVVFSLNSPSIVSKSTKSSTNIKSIYLKGSYNNNNLTLDNYSFNLNDYKIFSNKVSTINIDKSNLNINKLWINDSLIAKGNYNIDKSSGNIKLNSTNFTLDSQKAKVALAIASTIKLNKDKKDIAGVVTILNGKIKSTITQKNIADNEDIVILQRKRAKESTDFAKNIKLNIKFKNKKGLVYSQNGSYFNLIPNMTIKKSYNKLSDFRGVIKVAKGSYYTLNGKKLKVSKGLITFKGKSSSPNINIELKYIGKEFTVYINISGTPTRPILYFRSNPQLTKDQILAYLLFDDSSAIGTHTQDAMLNMVGGSLAKSLLGSIGIKIDHISVKENGFSIGKNITKNVTVYYSQDKEKPSIKTRIDITDSIHTELEVGKDKQSADIIFSKEY